MKNMHTQTLKQIFKELVPSILPLLKEHMRLGHAGVVNHSIQFTHTRLNKKIKKGMDRNN